MAILQKKGIDDTPQISVIIATYGRPELAAQLARKLIHLNQNIKHELLIIHQEDNVDSSQHAFDLAKNIYVSNVNLSAARNIGLTHARAPIVLYLDDDVEVTEHTLSEHIRCYEDSRTVAVAGRVINDDEHIPMQTDVQVGYMDKYATSFTQNFWSTKKQNILFPYGCNMSFRTEVLKKTGGFDKDIPAPLSAFEEIDAALNVRKYGNIVFSPEALVYHHKYPTGGTRLPHRKKMKMFYLCYGYFISKHVPFPFIIISVIKKSATVMRESPYALGQFYKGILRLL